MFRQRDQLLCQHQLACLVLSVVVAMVQCSAQSFCGEALVEVMAVTCGERGYYGMSSGGIHGRSVSRSPFVSEERAHSFLTSVQTRNRRRTGQIVTECCINRCTRRTLESYCNAAPTQLPTEMTTGRITTTEPSASPRRNSRNIAGETDQPSVDEAEGERPGKGKNGKNNNRNNNNNNNNNSDGTAEGGQQRKPKCGKKKIREGRCPTLSQNGGGQRTPDTPENQSGNRKGNRTGRTGGGSSRGGSSHENPQPTRVDPTREQPRGEVTSGGSAGAVTVEEHSASGDSNRGSSSRNGSSRGGSRGGGSKKPKPESSSENSGTTSSTSAENRNDGETNSNEQTEVTSSQNRNNGGKGSGGKLSKSEKKKLRKLERRREKALRKVERQREAKKKNKKKKTERERRTTNRWNDGLSRKQQVLRGQRLLSYRTRQRSYEYLNAIRRMIDSWERR